MKHRTFTEITVTDGIGEFMCHIDKDNKCFHVYTYAEDLGQWPKEKDYDETDAEWAEREVYCKKNYKEGANSLYSHSKSEKWASRVWENHLRNWVCSEDEDNLN